MLPNYRTPGIGMCHVALREGGTPIGMCGLLKRDTLDHPDLGFAFLPEHWGKGYALEAARAALEEGARHGVGRVLAIVSPANPRSIALLEKLGFGLERRIRMPGEDVDICLYARPPE